MENSVPEVGSAASHGLNRIEQLRIVGAQIVLRQLPVGFPRQCVRSDVVRMHLPSADWFKG